MTVYTYDTFGRVLTVTQGSGGSANTHTYAYKDYSNGGGGTFGTGLGLHSETVAYGAPSLTRTLVRHQDSLLRPAGWEFKNGGSVVHSTGYGYDTAGRLKKVDPAYPLPGSPAFSYDYVVNSGQLVSKVTSPVHQAHTSWKADRDVIFQRVNIPTTGVGSGITSSIYDYTVNAIGQRNHLETAGSAMSSAYHLAWSYNVRGELVTEDYGANTTADGRDRVFQFDAIGNREKTASGTLSLPGSANYTANALNQYTVANGVTLPTPAFDADGNHTHGPLPLATGNATLEWDAENQLVKITRADSVVITYAYDYQGRRISKTVAGGTARHFFYEGWNPIAEYAGTTLDKTYLWGMDLSGSIQGAGGVGGLLAVKEGAYNYYPTFDGNGNVSEYLDAAGISAAHYEYDAFGNTVASSGTKQADFAHRFSTKFFDPESGFYYYGYRYFDPVTGRWPSRDPIEESGGVNLYGFAGNDGLNWIDVLGLKKDCIWLECVRSVATLGIFTHCAIIVQCDKDKSVTTIELHGPNNLGSVAPSETKNDRTYPYSPPEGRDIYPIDSEKDCCELKRLLIKFQKENPFQRYWPTTHNSNYFVKRALQDIGANLRPYPKVRSIPRVRGPDRKVVEEKDCPADAIGYNYEWKGCCK